MNVAEAHVRAHREWRSTHGPPGKYNELPNLHAPTVVAALVLTVMCAPVFEELAQWMTESERRRDASLHLIASYLDERQQRDTVSLATALAETQEDVLLTRRAQAALLDYVERSSR